MKLGPKKMPAGATGRAQHPRPLLGATPDDPRTDFAACWARLLLAWHLAGDQAAACELTVADLRAAALELFSAGGVHHARLAREYVDQLGRAPERAWLGLDEFLLPHLRPDLPDTELEEPDCSGLT